MNWRLVLAAILFTLGLTLAAPHPRAQLGLPAAQSQLYTAPSGGGCTGYTGPGDILSWEMWIGLRAFSCADRGNAVVNVCNSTGGTDVGCGDLSTNASTGALVAATIGGITCPNASNTCTIKEWYDRSGNGVNFSQTTISKRAIFGTTNCAISGGSPVLCAYVTAGNGQFYVSSNQTISQPFSYSVVTDLQAGGSGYYVIGTNSGTDFGSPQLNFTTTPALSLYESTSVNSATVSVTHMYAMQALASGASSDVFVNGTRTTGTIGTSGFSSEGICIFAAAASCGTGGSAGAVLYINEGGIVSGGMSNTQESSMNSNQRAFWGF